MTWKLIFWSNPSNILFDQVCDGILIQYEVEDILIVNIKLKLTCQSLKNLALLLASHYANTKRAQEHMLRSLQIVKQMKN